LTALREFAFEFLAPARPRISKVRARIRELEAKERLTEAEERELEAYRIYAERYDEAWRRLGEWGQEAFGLWSMLDGQRAVGMETEGPIRYEAMEFLFGLYGYQGDEALDMFRLILDIDGVMSEVRERWRGKSADGK